MSAYYNEIDPFAAAWLRNLIKGGHIADGEVDERDIRDIAPSDLNGFTQCHFFAGIGGWSHALRLAGWPDDRPAWTGSCPCQPFSAAGSGAGFTDERHLWPSFFHLISARNPVVVIGEQVEAAVKHGWLDLVQDDLEGVGYSFGAIAFPAGSVGAPHKRQRLYFVADAERREQPRQEPRGRTPGRVGREQQPFPWNTSWESALREFRIVDDGLSYGVEALDAVRNAIVAPQAQAFVKLYLDTTN